MPFVRAADLTVHYDLSGPAGAPVVLFANSLGTNFHVWDPQAAHLAGRYRALRYDMRGHGLTDLTPVGDGYLIGQLAADALALLDALGIGRVHVCGLSIGGMVAQLLGSVAAERVASLVLCDTASRIGPPQIWDDRVAAIRHDGLASLRDGVMARWFTEATRAQRPNLVRGAANMLTRTPAEGYVGCSLAIRDADLREDAARIRCPTLVLVGDQDLATPPAAARELAASIPGARLAVIEGAGHIPTLEQPDAVNAHLAAFLAEVTAQEGTGHGG
ncbi:3-oxoadipate enol-lactonase [Azospirillum sp.]|uniref:3-oxoadipate enol-lactonase n=1 Tax=Azospirillum sp. TaxID=34012 RepID=UPI002D4CFF86|nr:3-oxoadipate enol-lactonase [Azospirillum sp.]HYD70131.1 3-oxoadipate enol-lactonase [Azospirillum sp.]